MSSSPKSQPTFDSIAPRFVVQDLEQALAFYGQLGFQTAYQDEAFAIVTRDGIDLHLEYTLTTDSCTFSMIHDMSGSQKPRSKPFSSELPGGSAFTQP